MKRENGFKKYLTYFILIMIIYGALFNSLVLGIGIFAMIFYF